MDICVIGYPKVGTTWLTRLLGDVLDSPTGAISKSNSDMAIATEGQDRSGNHYVGHGHPVPKFLGKDVSFTPNFRVLNMDAWSGQGLVLMCRDPRAVAVSAKHHWNIDTITAAANCMIHGTWPVPHGGGWDKFYNKWFEQHEYPVVWALYESLWLDTEYTLRRILRELYLPQSNEKIREAVERQSFAQRKGWTEQHGDTLNYGKEFQLKFLRKGTPDSWKDEMLPEEQMLIDHTLEWNNDDFKGN